MYICMYVEDDGSIMTGKIDCVVFGILGDAMRFMERCNVATVVQITESGRKLIHSKNREN